MNIEELSIQPEIAHKLVPNWIKNKNSKTPPLNEK